jgi:hypothetical protein
MTSRHLRLRVETERHIIEGILQLPGEGYRSRTTDYLNAHDSDFIALTDASVLHIEAGKTSEHDFVAVNLRQAVLVVELEPIGGAAEESPAEVATLTPVRHEDVEPEDAPAPPAPVPEPAPAPSAAPPAPSAPPPGAA